MRGLVLVVDDDAVVRTVAKSMLERSGFEVLLAGNGRRAIELFAEHSARVTVVLLDLTMPRMGGREALSELRRIRQDVPVLISTGHYQPEAIERLQNDGATGFLEKPYNRTRLVAAIEALLPG